jgi:hypothetical protein
MKTNYSQKEMDLAIDYLRGDINEIQLNYLSAQNNTEPEKIKKIAQKLKGYSIFIKNMLLVLLTVFIFFYFKLILNQIYKL